MDHVWVSWLVIICTTLIIGFWNPLLFSKRYFFPLNGRWSECILVYNTTMWLWVAIFLGVFKLPQFSYLPCWVLIWGHASLLTLLSFLYCLRATVLMYRYKKPNTRASERKSSPSCGFHSILLWGLIVLAINAIVPVYSLSVAGISDSCCTPSPDIRVLFMLIPLWTLLVQPPYIIWVIWQLGLRDQEGCWLRSEFSLVTSIILVLGLPVLCMAGLGILGWQLLVLLGVFGIVFCTTVYPLYLAKNPKPPVCKLYSITLLQVLQNKPACLAFEDHLKSEYCNELFFYWEAMEKLKPYLSMSSEATKCNEAHTQELDSSSLCNTLRELYVHFLSPTANFPVNLSDRSLTICREGFASLSLLEDNSSAKTIPPDLVQTLLITQGEVYQLMMDPLVRFFAKSPTPKPVLELLNGPHNFLPGGLSLCSKRPAHTKQRLGITFTSLQGTSTSTPASSISPVVSTPRRSPDAQTGDRFSFPLRVFPQSEQAQSFRLGSKPENHLVSCSMSSCSLPCSAPSPSISQNRWRDDDRDPPSPWNSERRGSFDMLSSPVSAQSTLSKSRTSTPSVGRFSTPNISMFTNSLPLPTRSLSHSAVPSLSPLQEMHQMSPIRLDNSLPLPTRSLSHSAVPSLSPLQEMHQMSPLRLDSLRSTYALARASTEILGKHAANTDKPRRWSLDSHIDVSAPPPLATTTEDECYEPQLIAGDLCLQFLPMSAEQLNDDADSSEAHIWSRSQSDHSEQETSNARNSPIEKSMAKRSVSGSAVRSRSGSMSTVKSDVKIDVKRDHAALSSSLSRPSKTCEQPEGLERTETCNLDKDPDYNDLASRGFRSVSSQSHPKLCILDKDPDLNSSISSSQQSVSEEPQPESTSGSTSTPQAIELMSEVDPLPYSSTSPRKNLVVSEQKKTTPYRVPPRNSESISQAINQEHRKSGVVNTHHQRRKSNAHMAVMAGVSASRRRIPENHRASSRTSVSATASPHAPWRSVSEKDLAVSDKDLAGLNTPNPPGIDELKSTDIMFLPALSATRTISAEMADRESFRSSHTSSVSGDPGRDSSSAPPRLPRTSDVLACNRGLRNVEDSTETLYHLSPYLKNRRIAEASPSSPYSVNRNIFGLPGSSLPSSPYLVNRGITGGGINATAQTSPRLFNRGITMGTNANAQTAPYLANSGIVGGVNATAQANKPK
eukprot:gb/GEZN01000768.1/.p1 GENE.gb/GEZN01000768.1/~~gb/GEZN01000768.1/.p1  ORF type:complete len:1179 (+),score=94.40 gb/GEZN01000768.1/:89-3625(+)